MKITVDSENINKRLDLFILESFFEDYLSITSLNLSRSKVQTLIERGQIKLNQKTTKPSYKLKKGDVVDFEIKKEEDIPLKPKNIPLDIVFEDDDLIVLNKQKGLICHPSAYNREDTLVNALLYHTDKLSDIEGKERQGIVHRLDVNTSGLMLVAKNNQSHTFLKKDIQNKKTVRKYLGICHGILEENEGIIEKPLVHYIKDTVKMKVSNEGLYALTKYRVIEKFKNSTFVELELKTGRTHQIRVHLSSINHPLIGDELYGSNGYKIGIFKNLKTEGQVLMSYYLSFTHPKTNEIMKFEIDKENYHPDLKKVLKLLRSEI